MKLTDKQNKSFGLVLIILLSVIYYFTKITDLYVTLIFAILAFIVIFITCYFPKVLSKPNKLWLKFGTILGNFTGFIILSLIFLCLFFPIGLLLRLTNILNIDTKFDNNIKSYWIKRTDPIQSMKKQF